MELLDKLAELLSQYGTYIALAGGLILDLALRITKTKKPLSLLRIAAKGASSVAKLLESIAALLDKLVADKVK